MLPGKNDKSFVVTALQRNVSRAMVGMASPMGIRGWTGLSFIIHRAIGLKKNMCIRYIPNDSRESSVMATGALDYWMQENRRNSPKVVSSTLGVQKPHDHSISGIPISTPGSPFHQKLHAVKTAPRQKQEIPTDNLLPRDHLICLRI